jgi:hypothetical protein
VAFTTLYLTDITAPYTPATIRGAWDDTAGAVTRALSPQNVGPGAVTSVSRAEAVTTNNYDVLLYRGVSGKLGAQTISGTLDVVIGVDESSLLANMCYHLHVYVTQGDSDTPRGTLLSNYVETTANEWPATASSAGRALASAQSLSSLAVSAGDRLVVEIGYVAINTSGTSFIGTLYYGTGANIPVLAAGGASATGVGSITFSSSITEDTAPAIRATQHFAELVSNGSAGDVRVTQHLAELVSNGNAGKVRASQFFVEILHDGVSGVVAHPRAYVFLGPLPGSTFVC